MRPISELIDRIRRWLAAGRRRQIAAAGALAAVVAAIAAGVVLATSEEGDGQTVVVRTATPSPEATRARSTATPTPARTPATTRVRKPDPQTLLQPGYVLDESLEVNLDDSEVGQIVVISHTSHQGLLCSGQALDPKTGTPLPTPQLGCEDVSSGVPPKEGCVQDPNLDPAACWFRAEVFAYDSSAGWSSSLVTSNHRGGVQDLGDAQTFRLDDEREAVVLAFHYCTGIGSGCGWVHEVVSMQGGEVKSVYSSWQARETIDEDSATFVNPVVFFHDAFCCPSGIRTDLLALDPGTNELGVIESRLEVCSEGTLAHGAGELSADNLLEIRCESGPGASLVATRPDTTVDPPAIGGTAGLREGDQVRIEYTSECESATSSCTLVATRIQVLNR